MRLLRPALVVARRDFLATVLAPTFLVFLLAPLLMLGAGAVGGFGAERAFEQKKPNQGYAVLLPSSAFAAESPRVAREDAALKSIFPPDNRPANLFILQTPRDPARAAPSWFRSKELDVSAILYGLPDAPVVLRRPTMAGKRDGLYLAALARTLRADVAPVRIDTIVPPPARGGGAAQFRDTAAVGAVFVMFLLTILLAGQAIGMLAEERSNKVIEILAAAVPLEAVFLGKLLGLVGIALLFVGFWGAIGAPLLLLLPPELVGEFAPAANPAAFVALFLVYFVMALLLFGALFLGVGAQAGSQRELQMLTLPVTLFQVAMFGLSSVAAGQPDSVVGRIAAVFPFSSPFAMAARAASGVPAWQHVAGLGWQLLWLALTITLAARLFRRGVLKSGGVRRRKVEL